MKEKKQNLRQKMVRQYTARARKAIIEFLVTEQKKSVYDAEMEFAKYASTIPQNEDLARREGWPDEDANK